VSKHIHLNITFDGDDVRRAHVSADITELDDRNKTVNQELRSWQGIILTPQTAEEDSDQFLRRMALVMQRVLDIPADIHVVNGKYTKNPF
jgi:hypothetical protein